ncbi:MAG: hypothetical protein ACK4E3_01255 [Brevundimonas sp.]|uniref:hypothetical protein n=1 Tax=Brevundimonas sp. TaxID=1871086 RepID=UPI00391A2FBA
MRLSAAKWASPASMMTAMACTVLVACEAPQAPVDEDPPEPPARTGWSADSMGPSVSYASDDGTPLIRLTCLSGPARIQVVGERFEPIASEDRMSVGVGDEVYAFVADLESSRSSGVLANGDAPDDLLQRLEAGGEIGLSYGAQSEGPVPGLTGELAANFVAACRG